MTSAEWWRKDKDIELKLQIVVMHDDEGLTHQQIGDVLKLRKSSVQQKYWVGRHYLAVHHERPNSIGACLSVRAINVLKNMGLLFTAERSDVRAILHRLQAGVACGSGRSIKNLGVTTLREIEVWLNSESESNPQSIEADHG